MWRTSIRQTRQKDCLDSESNTGPPDLQSGALPTELSRLWYAYWSRRQILILYNTIKVGSIVGTIIMASTRTERLKVKKTDKFETG